MIYVSVTAGEVFSTITKYTTTHLPYLPTYVSQYPEARVSSACSCISQPVVTLADYSYVTVSVTDPVCIKQNIQSQGNCSSISIGHNNSSSVLSNREHHSK